MYTVSIFGAGQIGQTVAKRLSTYDDYAVTLIDQAFSREDTALSYAMLTLDCQNQAALEAYFQQNKMDAVVSCLPFYCNARVATLCATYQCHYFDITEDEATVATIMDIANGSDNAFVPQCGLAPGMINILAHAMVNAFDTVDAIKMRVGALPQRPVNELKYALTWSIDGLINEYVAPCRQIIDGKIESRPSLDELESMTIKGQKYEAFNTSGGCGSVLDDLIGKVNTANYKTVRYPGHCEQMKSLLQGCDKKNEQVQLKQTLQMSLPRTQDDIVLMYVEVDGTLNGQHHQQYFEGVFLPESIETDLFTAIQLTTSAGVCSALDIVLADVDAYKGYITHDRIDIKTLAKNRFAQYFNLTRRGLWNV